MENKLKKIAMINPQQYKCRRMESKKKQLIKRTQKNKMRATKGKAANLTSWIMYRDKLIKGKTRNDEVWLKKSILKDEIKKRYKKPLKISK
jgi:nitric oxide reductase activation protein